MTETTKSKTAKSKNTKSKTTKVEKHEFQAEVREILNLVIHSLYSNREIFLRELVSNASDACDKLRFEALQNEELLGGDSELKIEIEVDEDAGLVTVRDNGIGMSRQDVVENIGTIARSGTKKFLENISEDKEFDSNLIGQFGVGFYSSFIVADKVTLKTRAAGSDSSEGVVWESDGSGEYTLSQLDLPKQGTEVTLHLREDAKEFKASLVCPFADPEVFRPYRFPDLHEDPAATDRR